MRMEIIDFWKQMELDYKDTVADLETNEMLHLIARFSPPDFPLKLDKYYLKKPLYYRPSYKDLLYSMRDIQVMDFNEYSCQFDLTE